MREAGGVSVDIQTRCKLQSWQEWVVELEEALAEATLSGGGRVGALT